MHGLLPEAELRAKADALAEETGNSVTYQTANLMDAAEIRCVARCGSRGAPELGPLV